MLFSKTCEYAIRASLYIALTESQRYLPIREIADKVQIPYHFLTKILQSLSKENILESSRGAQGGVRLCRNADDIRLIDIVYAIDGSQIFEGCVMGLPGCGTAQPCPFHEQWANIRSLLKTSLSSVTLYEYVNKIKKNHLRISDVTIDVDPRGTQDKGQKKHS